MITWPLSETWNGGREDTGFVETMGKAHFGVFNLLCLWNCSVRDVDGIGSLRKVLFYLVEKENVLK